jgi:gliding motility-associated-like protein/uncharacterized repeat protein (TIGR01451 family)
MRNDKHNVANVRLLFLQVHRGRKLLATFVPLFFIPLVNAGEIDFSIIATKTEVRQGDTLTYSVHVRNSNAMVASNILIVDSIPRGITLLSCSAAGYTLGNRSLLVRVDYLPVNADFSFDVTVRVNRKGSIAKPLALRENGATLKILPHTISARSGNVLTHKANAFTPNGDGVNDYFEIPGLLSYPNNELVVFNRYSDKVYQKRNYANDWDGSNLPAGSYYYFLTIYLNNSVVQKYNGAVAIKRQP